MTGIALAFDLVLAAAVLLACACMPGWGIVRLLELPMRLPGIAMLPASFAFGLALWSLLLAASLSLGLSIRWPVVAYLVVGVLLLAWSFLRDRRIGRVQRGLADAAGGWSIIVVALCALAAALLRTRMAFDTLFHVGMVRRLAQLDAPGFDNLDRIVGSGINPAYVLPSWQGVMSAAAWITGLDPATIVESGAIVGVVLAACCAAALGRVVTGTVTGELAAVSAYAFVRVVYPRRELEGDGIAYAVLPGNIAIDVLLVLVLACAVTIVRSARGTRRDGPVVALMVLTTALLVILHANYVVYLALVGVGVTSWLVAAGPWDRTIARRVGLAAMAMVVPGLVALAILLPVLMTLEHFGAPLEARIDYHLVSWFGRDVIRPGHLYDWFAAPGLVGILLVPWAAYVARGVARAVVAGGALAVFVFSFVPWLMDLLGASGSLTISLRLPRVMGIVIVVAAAIALPDLIARWSALVATVRARRGKYVARCVAAAPFVVVLAIVNLYGYPLVRREPAQYGWDWPTIVALVAMLVVLAVAMRGRRGRQDAIDAPIDPSSPVARRLDPVRALRGRDGHATVPPIRTTALALVVLAAALLPSGLVSMRRAGWQATEFVAAYRADDLACLDGVQRALRDVPPGDVLLADPVTAYRAQALAPAYIVGDFKVWNGSTDQERIDARIRLLNATFQAQRPQRAGFGLARLSEDFDGRWLLLAGGEVVPPIGSELYPYDAEGLRTLLRSGILGAQLVAEGAGRERANTTDEERAACDLQLWKLDGSERDLELEVDEHGNLVIEDLQLDAATAQARSTAEDA